MDSIQKGNFTMRILKDQLQNILKMGPVGQVMGMIPGFNNAMMPKVRASSSSSACSCLLLLLRVLGDVRQGCMKLLVSGQATLLG